MPGGFGGVAEYGITVRWNKNFLKLIRLLLERREEFALFGGVRFGGTLTADDALAMGFDHVACRRCRASHRARYAQWSGTRRTCRVRFPDGIPVMRCGSDQFRCQYAVALACSGDRRRVDCDRYGNEALADYPVQVDKFLRRYQILTAVQGEAAIRGAWDEEEREIAEEFLSHARAIRAERREAEKKGVPRVSWNCFRPGAAPRSPTGNGSSIAPRYTLNHEEVEKALKKESGSPKGLRRCGWRPTIGITQGCEVRRYSPWMKPKSWHPTGQAKLPARAVLVAAGTQPNTVLARED